MMVSTWSLDHFIFFNTVLSSTQLTDIVHGGLWRSRGLAAGKLRGRRWHAVIDDFEFYGLDIEIFMQKVTAGQLWAPLIGSIGPLAPENF
jgi:hypothetical protein